MKKLGVNPLPPISFGAIPFADFAFNSTKESPVPQIVNMHTSVPLALRHTQKSNAGEAKMINHPSPIIPLHQKQTSHKVIGSKHFHALPTPINVDKLAHYLSGYDSDRAQFLLNGFKSGFHLEFEGKRGYMYQFSPNLKSALENKEVVNDKIFKDLQACRIQGPFSDPPIPSIKISPLGIVPKKSPGQSRHW